MKPKHLKCNRTNIEEGNRQGCGNEAVFFNFLPDCMLVVRRNLSGPVPQPLNLHMFSTSLEGVSSVVCVLGRKERVASCAVDKILEALCTTNSPDFYIQLSARNSRLLPGIANRRCGSATRWNSICMIRIRLPSYRSSAVYVDILVLNHRPRRQAQRHKPEWVTARIF
jgi:hypothetical protein